MDSGKSSAAACLAFLIPNAVVFGLASISVALRCFATRGWTHWRLNALEVCIFS
jgi:hypothetical protein